MTAQLAITATSVRLLAEKRCFGESRLDAGDVTQLNEFCHEYDRLVREANNLDGLVSLGRRLYRWLDRDDGRIKNLINDGPRPLHLEVGTTSRDLTAAGLAVLRAPWELLADGSGYLAVDDRLQFSPARRLGKVVKTKSTGKYCLGVVFMAASPEGVEDLDYEAEESAIIAAAESTKIDLVVDETGNPDELARQLRQNNAMQVVHLSGHGTIERAVSQGPTAHPRALLLMEDLEGRKLLVDAGVLLNKFGGTPPRFIVLSACHTAGSAGGGFSASYGQSYKRPSGDVASATELVAHSLAMLLVDGGAPAVLGWDGSVADTSATAFLRALYLALADRRTLFHAVAEGRRALLNAPDEVNRRDWHLARLWLGPCGGDAIVTGSVRRDMRPNNFEQIVFLAKKQKKVPVASHAIFVGRRRELQKALKSLREREYAGVLLHGMGRLGKTSLAARIANRRKDLKIAVVVDRYGEEDILKALREAFSTNSTALRALDKAAARVRENPSEFQNALAELLRGPCAQTGGGGCPVLLIIDDLERILEPDPGEGRHHVCQQFVQVIKDLLTGFDPNFTDSRLVVTNRFPFQLSDVESRLTEIQLTSLPETAQRKLELRQKEVMKTGGLIAKEQVKRAALLSRATRIACGNPGLQHFIGKTLILTEKYVISDGKNTIDQALDEVEAWLLNGVIPSDEQLRNGLEDLGLNAPFRFSSRAEQDLLRGMTLFEIPVPKRVTFKLADLIGGSIHRLCDLGLLDALLGPAYIVNALARRRTMPLTDKERQVLAKEIVDELFQAWGGNLDGDRPPDFDLQIARVALAAGSGDIVAATALNAVSALKRTSIAEAGMFVRDAVRFLEAQRQVVPPALLTAMQAIAPERVYAAARLQSEQDPIGIQIDRLDIVASEPIWPLYGASGKDPNWNNRVGAWFVRARPRPVSETVPNTGSDDATMDSPGGIS
jgi:hypothetical protein